MQAEEEDELVNHLIKTMFLNHPLALPGSATKSPMIKLHYLYIVCCTTINFLEHYIYTFCLIWSNIFKVSSPSISETLSCVFLFSDALHCNITH